MRRFQVLRHGNLRRYFAGYVPSSLGTAMASVALAFAVLDAGGSAVDLGYVFTAGIVPEVALTLVGGLVADRMGRRRTMLGADLLRTGSQGLLAVLLLTGHPPLWAFGALNGAVGAGNALFSPAFNGLVVEIAPANDLGDANALFGMAQSAASVLGPALAGALVALTGPAVVVAADAVSYAMSAAALAGLRLPAVRGSSRSILRDLADGWGEFRSRTWLWATTVQFALFNLMAWGPFLLLGPVLARAYLHGASSWGTILAAYGAGSVVGGLAALGRRPRRPLLVATISSAGYAAPLALLALHQATALVAAGAVVAGLGSAGFNIYWSASLQHHVPADAQARVFAFATLGAYSAGPIAYAAAGPVAAAVGARVVLGFGAVVAVAASLVVLALPAVRRVAWRE